MGQTAHNVPVICQETELAFFKPPSGLSCGEYTRAYIARMGGYVENPADVNQTCRFCQYAVGDQYTAGLNIFQNHVLRDIGIFASYVIFNFLVTFAIAWLWVGGARRIWRAISGKGRRERKVIEKERRIIGEGGVQGEVV
jgi:ABC-type multidrug transport system permease subunit